MNPVPFDRPVMLRMPGGDDIISDVRQADLRLHDNWPAARGKWYHAARRACARAARGQAPGKVARDVFEKAAAEARLS